MTNTPTILNTLVTANTDLLPRPDLRTSVISLRTASGADLPPPNGCMPQIADSGRISFGAAYRLPQSK